MLYLTLLKALCKKKHFDTLRNTVMNFKANVNDKQDILKLNYDKYYLLELTEL